MKQYNKNLIGYSQNLRREMTPEERHLWYDFLKNLPITVNRQKIIGNYIADFYVASKKIVIELDGKQHYRDDNKLSDMERDAYMRSVGITVLRYRNDYIRSNFEWVCRDIMKHIEGQ